MAKGLSHEVLSKWAKLIAAEVEPEREALAPMMLEAYLHGGRARRQLFKNAPTLGGILPDGGISLLPFAYLAFTTVVAGLTKIYNAGGLQFLTDLLSVWKNLLEIVKMRKSVREEAHTVTRETDPLLLLRRTMEEVQQILERQGLPTEQCELVSFRVMKVLLQEPAEAVQLVRTFHNEKE